MEGLIRRRSRGRWNVSRKEDEGGTVTGEHWLVSALFEPQQMSLCNVAQPPQTCLENTITGAKQSTNTTTRRPRRKKLMSWFVKVLIKL